jgi:hypothetical protein
MFRWLATPIVQWLTEKFSIQRVVGLVPAIATDVENINNKKCLSVYSFLKMGVELTPVILYDMDSVQCQGQECVELYLHSPIMSSWCGA